MEAGGGDVVRDCAGLFVGDASVGLGLGLGLGSGLELGSGLGLRSGLGLG